MRNGQGSALSSLDYKGTNEANKELWKDLVPRVFYLQLVLKFFPVLSSSSKVKRTDEELAGWLS
jgi:hypothetical protein